ncbi:L,D-transpeptidase, partial [Bifidobacterium longum]
AAATAAANEPTAVTRKQVPDSGKQGGSRKTQNTQNGDDKAAQSVDWKGPTGKQPDLSQYSDLSVEVSLAKQRVYVKSGGQTIYTMIASTGVDDATPHGSYTIDTRGEHFYNAEEGMGADYWVQFYGSYLFHSVPTGEAFGDYLPEEGAKLGQPASHGCVRLAVADAQWFYDQVPDGTLVTIA